MLAFLGSRSSHGFRCLGCCRPEDILNSSLSGSSGFNVFLLMVDGLGLMGLSFMFGCTSEVPKIRGTLFGGPYNKDPTI